VDEAVEPHFSHGVNGIGTSSPKRILVTDNEPGLRVLVADTVIREGFRADTAWEGEGDWKAFCLKHYDLIMTDHEMPRLTGLALIERLRALSDKPPCILISGSLPMPETILRGIVHLGAVLQKPFSASALIEKIFSLLSPGGSQDQISSQPNSLPAFGTLPHMPIG